METEIVNKEGFSFGKITRKQIKQKLLDNECFEVPECTQFFHRKKWDFENQVWIEGLTQEEIDLKNQNELIQSVKDFMYEKETDGLAFYKDIDLRITIALSGIDRNILFPKLAEIDTILYPPLNKIKTGDFASALFIFTNQTPPTDAFVLEFYNEALGYCQNYYETKYPK